jgi:hypothetical protein
MIPVLRDRAADIPSRPTRMRHSSLRIRSSVLATLVAVALGGAVLAGVGPLATPAHADDPQRAKELFQEGTRYFDLGQFDKAIDAFQSGYREKPDPIFLFNIAQAYRLSGDASKALFFYKGYLRNSPKAHNRADVEQKIQALQKQLGEGQGQAPHPTSPPTPTSTPGTDSMRPPTPPPAASAPPAAAPPPPPPAPEPAPTSAPPATAGPGDTPASDAIGGATTVATTAPPPRVLDGIHPLDFGLGVGIDSWSSGVQGKANASLALLLSGGYTFGNDPTAVFHFRLGGSLGYTFLKDMTSRDTFLSALVVPTLLFRASQRLAISTELGIGIVGISGMQAGSALLDPKLTLKISGTQSLLEIRPALGAHYQLTDGVGGFAAVAIDYSPKGSHFYQAISRTELLLGLTLRF